MPKINWKKITIKELAAIVCSELEKYGLEAILVGGACVTIYSNNKYVSGDLDLISYDEMSKIRPILEDLGFEYEKPKYFEHKDCKFYLEFLNPPVAITSEPVEKFKNLKTKRGTIRLLTPTDCVKDRLAAYYHWKDKESLGQAVLVAKKQKIDLKDIERWSKQEKQLDKYREFRGELRRS